MLTSLDARSCLPHWMQGHAYLTGCKVAGCGSGAVHLVLCMQREHYVLRNVRNAAREKNVRAMHQVLRMQLEEHVSRTNMSGFG
eukprot:1158188-Pelagomonas_calceolata.AAC.5